ncbi:MAG: hypothetical protein A2583_13475 [Bdellovibrionales bacterium RIFOXYD1_FULL_53_11]|nr:MAG: hypothetical protein A2583_13475 [Bdellovibrionales bacterium RIFOXYD1_FULL_53_11]
MGYTSYKLLAGQMPPPPAGTGQVYGQMMLGGGGGGQITRQSANGSITLSLASNTTPTNITGTIQISPAEQQIITSYVMSGQIPLFNTTPVSGTYMYPTYPYTYGTPTQIPAGQQICVSNIAISASIYQYSSGQASFGSVDIAVYLNNTMHGYVLML